MKTTIETMNKELRATALNTTPTFKTVVQLFGTKLYILIKYLLILSLESLLCACERVGRLIIGTVELAKSFCCIHSPKDIENGNELIIVDFKNKKKIHK